MWRLSDGVRVDVRLECVTACLPRALFLTFFLLIRTQQGQLSEAKMRETDEWRGSGVPEIDQNQTGLQSTGGHREGRNVGL